MREHGKKKEGFRNVLPPQIFNGEKYCGVSVIIFIKILCKKIYFSECFKGH